MRSPGMQAAINEARAGEVEGGIPIGSALEIDGEIVGRGHNRRVQKGSAILHGEMDALENAGRLVASEYRRSVIYTTLSPCQMCTGAILLYGIYGGVTTPTEAAAVAAFYALILATVFYRSLSFSAFGRVLVESARSSAAVGIGKTPPSATSTW